MFLPSTISFLVNFAAFSPTSQLVSSADNRTDHEHSGTEKNYEPLNSRTDGSSTGFTMMEIFLGRVLIIIVILNLRYGTYLVKCGRLGVVGVEEVNWFSAELFRTIGPEHCKIMRWKSFDISPYTG